MPPRITKIIYYEEKKLSKVAAGVSMSVRKIPYLGVGKKIKKINHITNQQWARSPDVSRVDECPQCA